MKKIAIKIMCIAVLLGMVFSTAGCVAETQATTVPSQPVSTVVSQTTADSKIIKIGFLTPLTGTSAALGKQVLQAANMIVDLINEDHPESHMALGPGVGLPNLKGAKIELVVADHKSDAATAVAEAKRLITEEHVVAITGEFTSALIKAVAVVTEQYQIPLLAAGSAVSLTDGSTPLQWFFRFGVNDATYIKDTFDFLQMLNDTQKAGIKTVALFSEDSEFGANIVKQEVKFADLGGFKVVNNITYPANSTNLTSEVLKIKESNPDVLIMASFSSDASLFINTAIEQQYTPKLIIGQRGGFIQPDYLSTMGVKNNYILTTGSWAADQKNVVAQELEALYPAKYSSGLALSDAHVKDIACLLFVAMAINQAGTTDSVAVRDAIHNFKFDPATLFVSWKGISIDQYGQNSLANGVVAQYLDGKYQTVYPVEVAAMKAVYPMPGFGK
jgi:branched-chain amino acid transport system substrate-binding protein